MKKLPHKDVGLLDLRAWKELGPCHKKEAIFIQKYIAKP